MGRLFGTDGVRGEANTHISPELAFKLGRAGAFVLTKKAKHTAKVLLAKDSRRSGDMLEAALIAGFCSIGAHVYPAGVLPTPAIAYLIRHYNLDAGVSISGSHNPMGDNGIKFFSGDGYKLPDYLEDEIENLMDATDLPRPVGEGVGMVKACPNAAADYTEFLLRTIPRLDLSGMKLVLDCANGATSTVAPVIFKRLGANVCTINNKPDGSNINKNCGSTHIDGLCEAVKQLKADAGLAFDGDGDRVLAVDEKGAIIDGDVILAVCGLDLLDDGKLTNNSLVATIMSNQGLEWFCKKKGINLLRTDVGDRYVLEKMLEEGLNLGGEQSGHVIFKEHNTTGDGILTGLMFLASLVKSKKPLSELAGVMEPFPQVLVNAAVPNHRKPDMFTYEKITDGIKEIETILADEGRILVRPSGTEPVVRVMIEGRDLGKITQMAKSLAKTIEDHLTC